VQRIHLCLWLPANGAHGAIDLPPLCIRYKKPCLKA